MENSLFNGKEYIFRDVIRLGDNRRKILERSNQDTSPTQVGDFLSEDRGMESRQIRDEIDSYLRGLELEDIKMLHVVMYIGRDQDHLESDDPEETYRDYLESLSFNEAERDMEIRQFSGKVPYPNYLRNGLEILKVDIGK